MSSIHDATGAHPEDATTRVAQTIFAYRWPRATWADPLFRAEQEDCRLLAVQFAAIFRQAEPWVIPSGPGLDDHWRAAFVARQFAVVLAALVVPRLPFDDLDVADRAWLKQHADLLVEDAIDQFTTPSGDPEDAPADDPAYWGLS